jgi:hypothetical protein
MMVEGGIFRRPGADQENETINWCDGESGTFSTVRAPGATTAEKRLHGVTSFVDTTIGDPTNQAVGTVTSRAAPVPPVVNISENSEKAIGSQRRYSIESEYGDEAFTTFRESKATKESSSYQDARAAGGQSNFPYGRSGGIPDDGSSEHSFQDSGCQGFSANDVTQIGGSLLTATSQLIKNTDIAGTLQKSSAAGQLVNVAAASGAALVGGAALLGQATLQGVEVITKAVSAPVVPTQGNNENAKSKSKFPQPTSSNSFGKSYWNRINFFSQEMDPAISKCLTPPVVDAMNRLFQRYKLQILEMLVLFRLPNSAELFDLVSDADTLRRLARCYHKVWSASASEMYDQSWTIDIQGKWLEKVWELEHGPKCDDVTVQTLHQSLVLFDRVSRDLWSRLHPKLITPEREKCWETNAKRVARDLTICRRFAEKVVSDFPFTSCVFVAEAYLKPVDDGDFGGSANIGSTISLKDLDSLPTMTNVIPGSDVIGKLVEGSAQFDYVNDEPDNTDVLDPEDCADAGGVQVLYGYADILASAVLNSGRQALLSKCKQSAQELILMKEHPIVITNPTERKLKVCLFKASDSLCLVPLGGVQGYGVKSVRPGQTISIALPLAATTQTSNFVWMKVYKPKWIDQSMYVMKVCRGQRVELGLTESDCTIRSRITNDNLRI